MASATKRLRMSNLTAEEVLERLFEEGEEHQGMSSDEESEISR